MNDTIKLVLLAPFILIVSVYILITGIAALLILAACGPKCWRRLCEKGYH